MDDRQTTNAGQYTDRMTFATQNFIARARPASPRKLVSYLIYIDIFRHSAKYFLVPHCRMCAQVDRSALQMTKFSRICLHSTAIMQLSAATTATRHNVRQLRVNTGPIADVSSARNPTRQRMTRICTPHGPSSVRTTTVLATQARPGEGEHALQTRAASAVFDPRHQ